MDILAETRLQTRIEMVRPDLQRSLLAIDGKVEIVQVAGGVARHVHDAESAVVHLDGHGDAVVDIERIHADDAPLRLVVGLHARLQGGDVEPRAESDEVEYVDADVAEHASRAMGARQPPQPARIGAPVAPVRRRQPALQIARLDVADRADLAAGDETARFLDGVRVPVGQVDHVDDARLFRRLCHQQRIS